MEAILFYILASATLASALIAITRLSLTASSIWLFVSFISASGIFALLSSPVLAIFSLLLLAGAAIIAIAMASLGTDFFAEDEPRIVSFSKAIGALACAYLGFVLLLAVVRPPFVEAPASGETYEGAVTLAGMVFGQYAPAFVLTGVLLALVAIVAVVLLKTNDERRTTSDDL